MKTFVILYNGWPIVSITYDTLSCPPTPTQILDKYAKKYLITRSNLSYNIVDVLPMEEIT
jgi:hypothetical protein